MFTMRALHRLHFVFGLLMLSTALTAAERKPVDGEELCIGNIDRIYFSGNDSTKESVFRQELVFKEGDVCSLKAIETSRQNIMDLGLYSSVKASLTQYTGRLVLRLRVKEKHYILPIPRLSRTSDGEIRLGGQLRLDNFLGINHRLKITSERHAEDDGAGRKGFEHSFEYQVPKFQGTRYGMSVKMSRMDKQFELKRDGLVHGESNRIGDSIQGTLVRRRSKDAGSRGWQSKYRVRYERRGHDLIEGNMGPFEEGRNLELTVGVERNGVHLEKYRRRGHVYGASVSVGLGALGADYTYQSFDAFYRGYRPLDRKQLTNVNYNVELGYTNGTPFGERAFSIGGGSSVRGLSAKAIDGDVKFLMNLEYLQAVPRIPSMRWAGFWDIANIYPRGDFKPVYTQNGVGVGLLWKVVSFVKVDLRFDYAVSLAEKKGFVYFGTNLNF